ncbi:MAG: NAD-dependent epimerase/dehydratase family protein [Elusimicrobia bacterium]|nr:NAD-dependent epimerase/dehydratase family protein [Elusimicrobiota bacterium]
MRVIVTGAAGFVGSHLCRSLKAAGTDVPACAMTPEEQKSLPGGISSHVAGSIDANTDWRGILGKEDVIVHPAARVHVMRESAAEPLNEFRKVNTEGAANLARQAAAAGVKRFVFMSTVGVNGNNSANGSYTENDEPRPHNDYSRSKYEAELQLKQISSETGMEVVILRAPLVYGPGNPGNFLSLLGFVGKGIPLPLASVRNVKSFLYVGNLTNAIALCCAHPAAAGKAYLLSDGEDVSTPELIRRLSSALGFPARLVPFPLSLMRFGGRIIGKSAAVTQLLGSLVVDSDSIRRELGWDPPFTMIGGLKETANWYINDRKN